MNHTLSVLFLLLQIIFLTSAVDPPMSPSTVSCSDKLDTFSLCLPSLAESPNNPTDSPPPLCCEFLSAAFTDSSAVCLCYIVRNPKILGFPLNSSWLKSLPSVCLLKDNFSFQTLCSESVALPPIHSITDPSNGKPQNVDSPPAPIMGSFQDPSDSSLSPESADEPPTQPNLSEIPAGVSSSRETIAKLGFILLGFILLSFLVYIFTEWFHQR